MPIAGAKTVLVVDDEDFVVSLIRRSLERCGYSTIEARDGHEAIELFRERRNEIIGVILDLTMPRMSGEETFSALRQLDPDLSVIVSSGFPEEEAMDRLGSQGRVGFLHKPFRPTALVDRVRECFGPSQD